MVAIQYINILKEDKKYYIYFDTEKGSYHHEISQEHVNLLQAILEKQTAPLFHDKGQASNEYYCLSYDQGELVSNIVFNGDRSQVQWIGGLIKALNNNYSLFIAKDLLSLDYDPNDDHEQFVQEIIAEEQRYLHSGNVKDAYYDMKQALVDGRYEEAALLRDKLQELKSHLRDQNIQDPQIIKQRWRELLMTSRLSKSLEEIQEVSYQCCMLGKQFLQEGENIAFYFATKNEVDLSLLKKEALYLGKTVLFPKVISSEEIVFCPYEKDSVLDVGSFQIMEPQAPPFSGRIDVVFVPGLAFSKAGERLGHGLGYYDRFLGNCQNLLKIGVCYHEAFLEDIPAEEHDVTMDYVLTEKGIHAISWIKKPLI